MKRIHFEIGETAVAIISDEKYHKIAIDAIYSAREIILKKINQDEFFKTTFSPYDANDNDDELIKRMCDASTKTNVGPMAGVAGAIATFAVEKMTESGAEFAIVENGGDIALKIDRDITVGLYTGEDKINNLALSVPKRKEIFGICSSSGKVGPSISLGKSNICTVISKNVILADTAATALGNKIMDGKKDEIKRSMEEIGEIDSIDGCIVCSNGSFGMFGDVPQLTERKFDFEDASRIIFKK